MEIPHEKLPPPETIVAATLFLMTRHAKVRCPLVGRVIARQLQFLAEHPAELAPQLRAVCAKLSAQWAGEAMADGVSASQSYVPAATPGFLH